MGRFPALLLLGLGVTVTTPAAAAYRLLQTIPIAGDDGWDHPTVHSAARVCSAGHGGQILLSFAAQEAMATSLPAGIRLRELGRYSLAGLAEPESLFQVETAGLMSDFPRLRAKLAPRSRARRGAVLDFGNQELPLWPSASTTRSKTRS